MKPPLHLENHVTGLVRAAERLLAAYDPPTQTGTEGEDVRELRLPQLEVTKQIYPDGETVLELYATVTSDRDIESPLYDRHRGRYAVGATVTLVDGVVDDFEPGDRDYNDPNLHDKVMEKLTRHVISLGAGIESYTRSAAS